MKTDLVPLLRNDDVLIAPLPGLIGDAALQQFEMQIMQKCSKDQKVRGVVLDVSSLDSLDLFAARMLMRIAEKLSLMDVNSVMVGLRPEVAITLVEMEMSFQGLKTAINLEQGLQILKRSRRK